MLNIHRSNSKRIICGISGGVDSAVSALLLQKKGYEVIGAFMVNWNRIDEFGRCTSDKDFEYASRTCKILDIPLHRVELVKEYWTDVFQTTLFTYQKGFTPNPDILCNKHIKFDAFQKYIQKQFDCQFMATGHYARTNFDDMYVQNPELLCDESIKAELLEAKDKFKDQTFFLHQITNKSLKKSYFPIGNLTKPEVKGIAMNNNLEFVAKKKESMGICFIGQRKFKHFIEDYIEDCTGRFIDIDTRKVLGSHSGYFKYTIGQRSTLSVDQSRYYVVDKDYDNGDLFVAPMLHHPHVYSKAIIIKEPHWISNAPNEYKCGKYLKCRFRFMHQAQLVDCKIIKLDDGNCMVEIIKPLRCLTRGQFAVFYKDGACLGGGQILSVGPSVYEIDKYNNFIPFHTRKDIKLWEKLINEYGSVLCPTEYENIVYSGYK